MSESSPLDSFPDLKIANIHEQYAHTKSNEDFTSLMSEIKKNNMLPFYKSLAAEYGWTVDNDFVNAATAANQAEQSKLEVALNDATENQSEEDVRVAYQNLALFFIRIGDFENSKKRLADLLAHTVALGQKIDVVFCQMRVAFFFKDFSTFNDLNDQAQAFIKDGGDWERKNRLKVYEGLSLCARRNFIAASQLFISTISTYTATELLTYDEFIYRTVVLATLALSRADFGAKIDKALEVRAADEQTHRLLSLYHLNYRDFFDALAEVENTLTCDIWFSQHISYLIKELRVRAYSQFLEPYQALQISAMASAFGVTEQFIEDEIRRFIFSRKLNAKIDRVSGTIHTNPPDSRAAKMREALKRGEVLTARLQKLLRLLSA
ncbi:PCI domain containing protein [Trichomonas vaginalis G3]|uniref:PCI domain containing protein n=1 Tax=Trichomonas vaginalis (strain ATCC PRA-98 / G3) TaxID=412133 RepID=A2E0T9_TRIV3|nr:proteasome-mediated ubiquitin-dependent protein catabolic process [Trichomonas vaginalis G3]EAY13694.1 PCI domain containing protein [Trichomonas vaginalis G3]KAI5529604.1 proteasome-mediated ubiquitin-dependent protein catabolic process [Trichomonas vaginalis G3]|eukprot:XP_001325917.1 PCI domain containing protein [Trichomonas vaginalis G3]